VFEPFQTLHARYIFPIDVNKHSLSWESSWSFTTTWC